MTRMRAGLTDVTVYGADGLRRFGPIRIVLRASLQRRRRPRHRTDGRNPIRLAIGPATLAGRRTLEVDPQARSIRARERSQPAADCLRWTYARSLTGRRRQDPRGPVQPRPQTWLATDRCERLAWRSDVWMMALYPSVTMRQARIKTAVSSGLCRCPCRLVAASAATLLIQCPEGTPSQLVKKGKCAPKPECRSPNDERNPKSE